MIKKIRIMGQSIKIVKAPCDHMGMMNIRLGEIVIADNMSADSEADTVLHEVMHFIDFFVKTGLEEDQIAAMSSGLLAVLRDNPKLVDLITGR